MRADYPTIPPSRGGTEQTFGQLEESMSRVASDLSFLDDPIGPAPDKPILLERPTRVRNEPAPPTVRVCPTCSGSVDIRSRHVVVQGSAVKIFCSAECLKGEVIPIDLIEEVKQPGPLSRLRPLVAGS